ncbi:MAG TPA: hypothetical protein VKT25_01170, partial [Ktedonobacteraceae bacterium]|nr:hypothetical protein [Ktedonobacteraceae bacterium]
MSRMNEKGTARSSVRSSSMLVYRWIDDNVYQKSIGSVTTKAQPRKFCAINPFSADYHQQY